jgi:hypothetical protein
MYHALLEGVEIIHDGLFENEQVVFFTMSENEQRMNIRSRDIGLLAKKTAFLVGLC